MGMLLVTAGCPSTPHVNNLDSRGSQIICFGDSLTEGFGASVGEDYPSRLAEVLDVPVINAGVSGDTTEEALYRLQTDVLDQDPFLVIVILGANDFLSGRPRKETFGNLEEIVRRIQARGAMVLLTSVQGGLFGDVHQKHYQRIAKKYHTAFLSNIVDGIMTNPSLKSDTIHPNAAGYQKMADRILEAIKPLLAKRARRLAGSVR